MKLQKKTLSDLGLTPQAGENLAINGLTHDSRKVREGFLFAALPGLNSHGISFASSAIQAGACAILTDKKGYSNYLSTSKSVDAVFVVVEKPRETLARCAALWFDQQPSKIVAVTGTNGKTSVSSFCQQIWSNLDIKAVSIGTTGVLGSWTHPLKHTTPDALEMHELLATLKSNGVDHVALEASSHGLHQSRLDGVQFSGAGFTNFSQDHLDYHKSLDEYFAAKALLFRQLLPIDKTAVINVDDKRIKVFGEELKALGHSVVTLGVSGEPNIKLKKQSFDSSGQNVFFEYDARLYQKRFNLIGGFQAQNVLMAAALVISLGSDPQDVFSVLHNLLTVKGRMELAASRANGANVFIDYAHTPDAIETAITSLRPHVFGRIIAIIGAGGDRDQSKRPLMGLAASKNADEVIVTDDNPRSEDPAKIRQMIIQGVSPGTSHEYGDRAEAILRAVDMLDVGDALLICGKGHETGQVIGEDVLPFDDAEQASISVEALDGAL
jgi:UDP-N-acetylmuramoyl-L-alanyl-D-glutamate--2,6-diaminopimelate ligase